MALRVLKVLSISLALGYFAALTAWATYTYTQYDMGQGPD